MSKAHAYLFDVAEFDRRVEERGYKNTANFARLSGVPRSTLNGYRAQATCPSLDNVGLIMDCFPGLPMETFFVRNPDCVRRVAALRIAA